jgi:hypothetical protein
MNKKLFGIAGALAVLLISGLVLAGCDNGSTNKDEYHLKWGATYTTYSMVTSTIISQNWTITAQGGDYALATGSTATSVYNYCMNNRLVRQPGWLSHKYCSFSG